MMNLYRKCVQVIPSRGYKKSYVPVMREMKSRKKEEIKVIRPRSAFINWNYPAELYAFTKRLNEPLTNETARTAFIHKSYIEQEEKHRKELVGQEVSLNLLDNEELAKLGSQIMDVYLKKYLRKSYPHLPEVGILAVYDYLVTDELLAYVAKNIGSFDLILTKEYPPESATLASTFKAIVGAIVTDNGIEQGENFILDFVLTQLVGKDIHEIWEIPNPMGMLRALLQQKGASEPEPRLLRETGRNTIFAVYVIGIYVDQELIGQGPGETLTVAQEMAALDALRKMFKTTENCTPLKFEKGGEMSSSNAIGKNEMLTN